MSSHAGLPMESAVGIDAAIVGEALPTQTAAAYDGRSVLRACILSIDRLLRRYYGVREFSPVGDNLLRISMSIARQRLTLGDGTEIVPGDVIVDLHLWNERIPALGPFRCGLRWGGRAKQRIERSLTALAAHVETDPSLTQCKALRAQAVFLTGRRAETLARVAERLGFGAPVAPRPADPGHTMLAMALAWACHPGSPVYRRRRALRHTFWMSLQALRDRYLPATDGRP